MLWDCRFSWLEGTTTDAVRRRVVQQHAAGTNHPEKIRGWYNLAGGGAGFLLIEADNPRELAPILEPYMDLVRWDVHAVYELPYQEVTTHFQELVRAAGEETESAGDMRSKFIGAVEEFNLGSLGWIDELCAPDYVIHSPQATHTGRESYRRMLEELLSAFPDMQLVAEHVVTTRDRLVVRYSWRATHRGGFQGIATTGRPVSVTGMSLGRFADGQLVEGWDNYDELGLIRQLETASDSRVR